jgi:putative ABC transport system permease protein
MAWRETRASWARLAFFFLCVAIGVAAIVIIRSVIQTVRTSLAREVRQSVGADIVVRSQRPWTNETRAILTRLTTGIPVERADVVDTRTMAAPEEGKGNGHVRLVELRGVERGFPFYGTLTLQSGEPYSYDLLAGRGVLVTPEFLQEMGLALGDGLKLGGTLFTIRGAVTRDRVQPGGGVFLFGPRIYLALDDLMSLDLLGYGSRGTYNAYLKVPDGDVAYLTNALRRAYVPHTVTVTSWRLSEDRLSENLETAENYLSLVGFVIVVIGGIGVWSVTRVLVQQKIRSVAILKCVGASSGTVLATYVMQAFVLALAGSALAVGIAAVAIKLIPASILAAIGAQGAGVTASAALQGMEVGVLVSLLFALVPLLEMRRIKPLLLLRADTAGTARRGDALSRIATLVTTAALVAVAMWQAGSMKAGLFVSGGLAAVVLVLMIASRLLLRATAPLTHSARFSVRHAVLSLRRPGNQTWVILTAVGIGTFFVLSVRAVQTNLVRELNDQIGTTSPDLVSLDIQRDQLEKFKQVAAPYVTEPPRIMPLLRARVTAIMGKRVNLPTPDAIRQHGKMTREFGVTYRDAIQPNERVVAGRFWTGGTDRPPDPQTHTEVSISEEVRRETGADVGDMVQLDIGGQSVNLRVTSVRRVAWDQTQNGGFFFVLRPAPVMARLPMSFVGFLRTRDGDQPRAALLRDIVRDFRNVSAIDVRAVVAEVRGMLDNITVGVTVVGGVTVVCGILILVGAVAMTKFQRVYEAAVYRTLGATTRVLTGMVAVEYGLLGLLAATLGALGAFGLSWALMTFLFDLRWYPPVALVSAGALASAALVCVVGVLASLDVLLKKPLATLRQ